MRGQPAVWLGRAWDSDCALYGVWKPSKLTKSGWYWDIVKGWKECRVYDDIPCFDVDILKRGDALDICIRHENERRMLASPAPVGSQALKDAGKLLPRPAGMPEPFGAGPGL